MSHNIATSSTSPINNYVSSVVENFPRKNRFVKIEGSIESRYSRNFLPVNGQGVSTQINDAYTEFILTPSANSFFDLDTLTFEARLEIKKNDGTPIEDTNSFSLVDFAGFLLLEKSSVFLNGVNIENNFHFGMSNLIKSYTHMGKNNVRTFGAGVYAKTNNGNIYETFTTANDATIDTYERNIRSRCHRGIHLVVPITLDISSSNQFLMNSVEVRIRFDLACPKRIITSSEPNADYIYMNCRMSNCM